MEPPTLSNSRSLEPQVSSCIQLRPDARDEDLLSLDKMGLRTLESNELEKCLALEDDCIDGGVLDADGSTVGNKQQPPRSLRRGNLLQHKETEKFGGRGSFCCGLPWSEGFKVLLVTLLLSGFIAGCVVAERDTFFVKPGERVRQPFGDGRNCSDKRYVWHFTSTFGRQEVICFAKDCWAKDVYTVDESCHLCFTGSNRTAGLYFLIDDDAQEILSARRILCFLPPKSGATSYMPSGYLMPLGCIAIVFIFRQF